MPETIKNIPTNELRLHPNNTNFFPPGTAEDLESLKVSMQRLGQMTPIVVCGTGCAQPAGTILAGERRFMAAVDLGMATLHAREVNDLSADEEHRLLISDNLAALEHRNLTTEHRFRLEEELRAIDGRGQGTRTDLEPSRATGDAGATIANQLDTTASEIRLRRALCSSPVFVKPLAEAVDAGIVPLSNAAALVRTANRNVKAGKVGVEQARASLVADVERAKAAFTANGSKRPRRPRTKRVQPLGRGGGEKSVPRRTHDLRPGKAQTSERPVRDDLDVLARQARTSMTKLIEEFMRSDFPLASLTLDPTQNAADPAWTMCRWIDVLTALAPAYNVLENLEAILRIAKPKG
jgi:ParB-like chromosome segregation protein Spo0J